MTNTEKERKKYPTKFDPNNECPHGLISHKLCEICNNVRPVEDELFSTQQQLQETKAELEAANQRKQEAIDKAVAEERERCAAIADDMFHAAASGDEIALAIRGE